MTTSVLIVDDHAGFREAAAKVLESAGFVVAGEAKDGMSGIQAVGQLAPDVVLLDVQLSDIDGFEVIRRLRERRADVVVVLTSSRDATDYGSRVEQSGARGFIPKSEISGAALASILATRS